MLIIISNKTYFFSMLQRLTKKINIPIHNRIQPKLFLDINSGNNGVTHVSIVAMVSMDDNMFGIDNTHNMRVVRIRAMEWPGGLAEGNLGFDVDIGIIIF
jgi:hypothetical protein